MKYGLVSLALHLIGIIALVSLAHIYLPADPPWWASISIGVVSGALAEAWASSVLKRWR